MATLLGWLGAGYWWWLWLYGVHDSLDCVRGIETTDLSTDNCMNRTRGHKVQLPLKKADTGCWMWQITDSSMTMIMMTRRPLIIMQRAGPAEFPLRLSHPLSLSLSLTQFALQLPLRRDAASLDFYLARHAFRVHACCDAGHWTWIVGEVGRSKGYFSNRISFLVHEEKLLKSRPKRIFFSVWRNSGGIWIMSDQRGNELRYRHFNMLWCSLSLIEDRRFYSNNLINESLKIIFYLLHNLKIFDLLQTTTVRLYCDLHGSPSTNPLPFRLQTVECELGLVVVCSRICNNNNCSRWGPYVSIIVVV